MYCLQSSLTASSINSDALYVLTGIVFFFCSDVILVSQELLGVNEKPNHNEIANSKPRFLRLCVNTGFISEVDWLLFVCVRFARWLERFHSEVPLAFSPWPND